MVDAVEMVTEMVKVAAVGSLAQMAMDSALKKDPEETKYLKRKIGKTID